MQQKLSTHYVQIKGKYQPINVIPSGELKCFVCNRLYPRNSLDQHLNTHVQPKFLLPQTHSSNLKKMGVSQNLIDDINTEDSDINIHSMLPSELPSKQFQRKRAYIQHDGDLNSHDSSQFFVEQPVGDRNLPNSGILITALKMKADDNKSVSSNLGNQIGQQFIQILPLQTGVAIPMKHSKVSKKSIHVYKNEQRSYQTTNDTIFKKKQMIQSSPLIGQAYDIVQQKEERNYLNPQPKSIIGVKQSGKYKCNWSHAPSQKIQISTKNYHKKKDEDDISQTQLDYVSNRSRKDNKLPDTRLLDDTRIIPYMHQSRGDYCDCKCQCCGGFYCKVCNSNIPPKYRPVPNKDKKQQLDHEEIRQFWNMYYEKLKNRNICKNCQPDEILNIRNGN